MSAIYGRVEEGKRQMQGLGHGAWGSGGTKWDKELEGYDEGRYNKFKYFFLEGYRYLVGVARYLKSRCDTYRDTSLMLRLIDYQAEIKEA